MLQTILIAVCFYLAGAAFVWIVYGVVLLVDELSDLRTIRERVATGRMLRDVACWPTILNPLTLPGYLVAVIALPAVEFFRLRTHRHRTVSR